MAKKPTKKELTTFAEFAKRGQDIAFLTERVVFLEADILDLEEHRTRELKELRQKNEKLANQRTQLRMYQEKLELMRTWRGILRTIGQKLGVSR